jgi:hypothetical protein
MPPVQITKDEIDKLSQKLETVTSQLSDEERALLSSIFAVAADVVGRPSPQSLASAAPSPGIGEAGPVAAVEGVLTPIREQFVRSFTAGPLPKDGQTDDKVGPGKADDPEM